MRPDNVRLLWIGVNGEFDISHFKCYLKREKIIITFGNVYAEYSFLKNKELTFRTNVGVDLSFFQKKTTRDTFLPFPQAGKFQIDKC